MDKWLKAATDYIPQWLDYQMRQSNADGVNVAVRFWLPARWR